MANIKISELPAGSAATGDEIPVNKAGTTTKVTALAVAKLAVADAINNGTTDLAPSQNAVFDALALKANLGAGGTWTTESYTFSDFVVGNELETSVELTVVAVPAGTMILQALFYIDSTWNDPGDGLPIRLKCGAQELCGQSDVSGSNDFYVIATQAAIESPVSRVSEDARNVTILVNPAEFGVHTMSQITTGAVTVWVKLEALP